MSDAVFFRVLEPDPEQKSERLVKQIAEFRNDGGDGSSDVFHVDTEEFSAVPESPFAYWVDESVRRIFRQFPPLEGNAGTVTKGLATTYDFRFIRVWWEVAPWRMGYSRADTKRDGSWVHLAKGGAYSPYYADVHLVLAWENNGEELKAYLDQKIGRQNAWSRWINATDFYFEAGLTWPRRTTSDLSVRCLPEGCVFADKGPALFPTGETGDNLYATLGILQSGLVKKLLSPMLAAATGAARSYEVGVIERLPCPRELPSGDPWKVSELVALARRPATRDEVTHDFTLPSLTLHSDSSIAEARTLLEAEEQKRQQDLLARAEHVESRVNEAYGIDGVDAVQTDPALDLLQPDLGEGDEEGALEDQSRRVANLLMWCVGVAFGRWDVRMARDRSLIPDLQGPFERLPRVAPGGLVGPDGLPASEDRIASEAWLRARPDVITLPESEEIDGDPRITADQYPLDVAWDGVLVDDPGHPRDIVGKVREVLRYLYGMGRAEAIEEEALEILRADGRTPGSLRDWFRNRTATELGRNFFDFHVRRYSKSRRKAPIYWRLCSNPGRGQSEYGIWLYYHQLTDDTLWTVLNSYLGPKRERVEQRAEQLRSEIEKAGGSEARRLEKEREEALDLLEELRWFESELRKVAEAGWQPERDDGVVINVAPFHKVMRWDEPEKHWERLKKGTYGRSNRTYDWSMTAMRYWPERVREKCRTDRSLAIAHGLEELYESE